MKKLFKVMSIFGLLVMTMAFGGSKLAMAHDSGDERIGSWIALERVTIAQADRETPAGEARLGDIIKYLHPARINEVDSVEVMRATLRLTDGQVITCYFCVPDPGCPSWIKGNLEAPTFDPVTGEWNGPMCPHCANFSKTCIDAITKYLKKDETKDPIVTETYTIEGVHFFLGLHTYDEDDNLVGYKCFEKYKG